MARKRYSDEDILKLLREMKFIFIVAWMLLAIAKRQEFRAKPITAGERTSAFGAFREAHAAYCRKNNSTRRREKYASRIMPSNCLAIP